MSKIVFLKDKEKIYEGSFEQIGTNQIRIVFENEKPSNQILLSGFNLINEYNGYVQTIREDYKHVYRTYEDNELIVELCNDGVEYIAPEPIPEPEPYIPTLEEIKNSKINELSNTCNQLIENGVDLVIDGKTEHFSYSLSKGDQNNIDDIMKLAASTGLGQSYHCDNGNCRIYTIDQIVTLYIAVKINKLINMTYFNQMKQYIRSLDSDESKNMIKSISYGDLLTGTYLETYNENVEHSKLVIKVELANLGLDESQITNIFKDF